METNNGNKRTPRRDAAPSGQYQVLELTQVCSAARHKQPCVCLVVRNAVGQPYMVPIASLGGVNRVVAALQRACREAWGGPPAAEQTTETADKEPHDADETETP